MFDELIGEKIILRKAKEDDYLSMLENVWSDEEIYKWMLFTPTLSLADAKDRNHRSMEYQKDNYAYYVALKENDLAIGFCSVREYEDKKYKECGICVGRKYQGMGLGKEIVKLLLDLVFNKLNGEEFCYGYFQDNLKSKSLAEYFNFQYERTEEMIRPWDNAFKKVDISILRKEDYLKK